MKPVTLEDGTTITPNPPGYWWAAVGRIAEELFRDCHAMYEQATKDAEKGPVDAAPPR